MSRDQLTRLRADLVGAHVVDADGARRIVRGERLLGVIRPFGSVTLHLGDPRRPPLRLLDLDRHGHVTLAIRRASDGAFREARVRNSDGTWLALEAGGASHALWGASDRLARLDPAGVPEPLTVSAALDWDGIAAIPALADPSRLPPGAGTSVLNVLAGLAADQGRTTLRYRGPYPTEQLFWALAESFRWPPGTAGPLERFRGDAETVVVQGRVAEARLDWAPAPHERLFLRDESEVLYVQLRDGVEKVTWQGRSYYRPDWQGLRRREHRLLRPRTAPDGAPRFVAALEALGRPIEDHLELDAAGNLLARLAPEEPTGPAGVQPVGQAWLDALGALVPLEATPLLDPAIAAVWPAFALGWGTVPRDLVLARGTTLRLSTALVRAYRAERTARPAALRRPLAQALVREVLGLVAPAVRREAASWLEAEPAARRSMHLLAASRTDRREAALRAAEPLARLVDALEAGEALPALPAS